MESFPCFQRKFRADLVCLGHYVDTESGSAAAGEDLEPYLMEGQTCQRSILLGPCFQGFSWNKRYRLDIIRAFGLCFLSGMGTTEDLYFTYQYLARCDRTVHTPGRRVYHYYQRMNSTTRSGYSPQKLGTIHTYEKIITDCRERDPELAETAADSICTETVNLIWILVNSQKKDSEEMAYLRNGIRQRLPQYLRAEKYGAGRKLQAVLVWLCPQSYAMLKNMVHRR